MRVFKCNHCSRIHLEIGNTQIHFASKRHLQNYLEVLDSIDAAYYADLNHKKGFSKGIILPLGNSNSMHICFNMQEFEELKSAIHNYLTPGSASIYSSTDLVFKNMLQEICWN
ncbi:MAG: hypothetical protein LBD45_06850 [Bacteroidales bacterium]|jgi:hypothetical protein|nr:hypothetical protein [Bacteroidales bacterium]